MSSEKDIEIAAKLAGIENELKNMVSSLSEFKQGIGQRLEKTEKHTTEHCKEIGVLGNQVNSVTTAVYGFIGIVIVGVVGALLRTVLR